MASIDRLDATTTALTLRVTDSPLEATVREHEVNGERWFLTRLRVGEAEVVLWTPAALREQHGQALAAAAQLLRG